MVIQKTCALKFMASTAELAKRYPEMAEFTRKLVLMGNDLTVEERNLFVVAHKNVLDAKRRSWAMLTSIESKKNGLNDLEMINLYKKKVEIEISEFCESTLSLLDTHHLLSSTTSAEESVFFEKMRGDYYRYLAEVKTGDARKEATDESLKAYEAATAIADSELSPSHPIRIGLGLNFAVFQYEILGSVERACDMAEATRYHSLLEKHSIAKENLEDWKLIMELLDDNVALWSEKRAHEEFVSDSTYFGNLIDLY